MLTLFTLFALFAACTADDKPAPVGTFGGSEWPDQVDREWAEADGLTADDFDWTQWPVSDVHVRLAAPDDGLPAFVPFVYRCELPPETPQADQYDEKGKPLPDPVGLALAWVRFKLHDVDAGDMVDRDDRNHVNGQVEGIPPREGGELWSRLTPGTSLRVQLTATPIFYYLSVDGADQAEYSLNEDGYFHGAEAESGTYTLTMNQDGEVSIQ